MYDSYNLVNVFSVYWKSGVTLLQHELQRHFQRLIAIHRNDVLAVGHNILCVLIHIPEYIANQTGCFLNRVFVHLFFHLEYLLHPVK